jgi:tRNA A-37 threonylcarbamoyl transferase component Bud32
MEQPASKISPETLRAGGVRWRIRSAEIRDDIISVLREPDASPSDQSLLIKDSPSVMVTRLPVSLTNGRRWMLRKSKYTKERHVRRDILRSSGPMRAFRAGLLLERRGVATPRVLAAGIRRKLQRPLAGYLITEEVFPASTLEQRLKNREPIPVQAVARIAELVARLHIRRLRHGDLKDRNILLDGQLQPWLVDLDTARSSLLPIGLKAAAVDLYQLARTIYDYNQGVRFAAWRFVKFYCRARGWPAKERKLASATLAVAQRKIRWHERDQPSQQPR